MDDQERVDERVQEIRRRWQKATFGPFGLDGRRMFRPRCPTGTFSDVTFSYQDDAEFYAHAWDDVKYLVNEVRRLRLALQVARDAVDGGLGIS